MRKIFYQWAAVGILSLIGWGVDVMPNNTSWIPSTILWVIAGTWFIVTLVYILRHKDELRHSTENTTNPLEDIKSDLITMNSCERDVATKKAEQAFPPEVALKVQNRFSVLFGSDMVTFAMSLAQDIIGNRDIEPLIKMFKTFGDILDSTDYGLKQILKDNILYETCRVDLAKKRLKLTKNKTKNLIIQKNINRAVDLIYGLNSSIIIRSVLRSLPDEYLTIMTPIIIALQGIESQTEKTLNMMLNNLESEWRVTINAQL